MEIEKKELDIEWEDRKEKVIIRKLDYGEDGDITSQSLQTKYIGTMPQVTMDTVKFRQLYLWKSLMKAPFKFDTFNDILRLPKKLAKILEKEIINFNELEEEKKEN